MLRKAALDITLVVGWLMLLAQPSGHTVRADRKGLPAIFDVLQRPLGGWPGRQLVSLTPQQVVLCGIAVALWAESHAPGPLPATKTAGCLAASCKHL